MRWQVRLIVEVEKYWISYDKSLKFPKKHVALNNSRKVVKIKGVLRCAARESAQTEGTVLIGCDLWLIMSRRAAVSGSLWTDKWLVAVTLSCRTWLGQGFRIIIEKRPLAQYKNNRSQWKVLAVENQTSVSLSNRNKESKTERGNHISYSISNPRLLPLYTNYAA